MLFLGSGMTKPLLTATLSSDKTKTINQYCRRLFVEKNDAKIENAPVS